MAIIYSLSQKTNEKGQAEILIRYKSGKYAARAKSGIFILPEWYDFVIGSNPDSIYKGKRIITEAIKKTESYHQFQKRELSKIHSAISEVLNNSSMDRQTSTWLLDCLDKHHERGAYTIMKEVQTPKHIFFDIFDEFLRKRNLSNVRQRDFNVLKRALQRYELYRSIALELDTITSETIKDLEYFLLNEHTLFDEYKSIYDKHPADIRFNRKFSKPQQKSINAINELFKRLRVFFNWCNDTGKTTNRPFKFYESTASLYGSPIYISIEERNTIYNTDFSLRPSLAIQRDIFVFQCLIGCRVGDLYKMTKQSVINGAIEYIPRKTKDGHPITVRVPLSDTAKVILKRYQSEPIRLLPFISEQKYNQAIKQIFKIAGITRAVTVINPTTREEEKRPVSEIASSHLARRTFVGNLYKKVKDPNLVGALSGHQEGSKAFARYRNIDEEMKTELVKMLE